jgi:positive regulator of sigma E activity
MFKEVVEVVEKKDGKIKVRFEKKSLCSCCRFSFLCSNPQEAVVIDDNSNFDLRAGDKIEISIEEKKQLLAGLILFFVPAIIFLVSLILARGFGETKAFFLGVASILIYYLLIKIIIKKVKPSLNFKIIGKL